MGILTGLVLSRMLSIVLLKYWPVEGVPPYVDTRCAMMLYPTQENTASSSLTDRRYAGYTCVGKSPRPVWIPSM